MSVSDNQRRALARAEYDGDATWVAQTPSWRPGWRSDARAFPLDLRRAKARSELDFSMRETELIASSQERRQFAALPYVHDEDGQLLVLLITSRGTGRWVLPKGWPEGSESGPQAAAREAVEEAGVLGEIAPATSLGSYPYQKAMKDGGSVACRVIVFGLRVEAFQADFREKGRRVLRWCLPAYGAELVDEPELATLLRRVSANTAPVPASLV